MLQIVTFSAARQRTYRQFPLALFFVINLFQVLPCKADVIFDYFDPQGQYAGRRFDNTTRVSDGARSGFAVPINSPSSNS